MNNQSELRKAFNRVFRALKRKPAMGQSTMISTTQINGLVCDIREDNWQLKVDMPKQAGGHETAPTPGVLGRAALGSCLAIGYQLWAAKLEVPVESLEIEIQADSDDAGLYGTADVSPGYMEVRYKVRIRSSAPESDVLAVLDAGDKHSPWLDVFSRPINCRRELELLAPEAVT